MKKRYPLITYREGGEQTQLRESKEFLDLLRLNADIMGIDINKKGGRQRVIRAVLLANLKRHIKTPSP